MVLDELVGPGHCRRCRGRSDRRCSVGDHGGVAGTVRAHRCCLTDPPTYYHDRATAATDQCRPDSSSCHEDTFYRATSDRPDNGAADRAATPAGA